MDGLEPKCLSLQQWLRRDVSHHPDGLFLITTTRSEYVFIVRELITVVKPVRIILKETNIIVAWMISRRTIVRIVGETSRPVIRSRSRFSSMRAFFGLELLCSCNSSAQGT